jgi:hypothetical protein
MVGWVTGILLGLGLGLGCARCRRRGGWLAGGVLALCPLSPAGCAEAPPPSHPLRLCPACVPCPCVYVCPLDCREEMSVAWAEHTNLGDYTTAALIWLENCGKGEPPGEAGLLAGWVAGFLAAGLPPCRVPAPCMPSMHARGSRHTFSIFPCKTSYPPCPNPPAAAAAAALPLQPTLESW